MADERLRTKRELKLLFTNLLEKGLTDAMFSILIDTLWRDRPNNRTSGFRNRGGKDAVISFDPVTRIFTINPFDPEIEYFEPRYGIYIWSNLAVFHRIYDTKTIEIPDEEGLFCIYFDKELDPGTAQVLTLAKNPTSEETEAILETKVVISFLYWDAENNAVIHFGDDRHGSEWNPQIHTYLHRSFGARRKTGLQFTGYSLNGDGSSNDHAKFNITGGTMLHDDFELEIPTSSNSIPVLYSFGNYPRFIANNGYAFAGSDRVYFNSGQISLQQATSGNFVLYHIFATNEILTESRKIISVMGTAEYTTLADAYKGAEPELNGIVTYMPHQGRCYLGSMIVQTSDDYTNDKKARIVALTGNESHPPVTIAEGSEDVLEIDENQKLAIKMAPPADGLASGGIITWLTGLTIAVSQTIYYLGGRLYPYVAQATTVTLDEADATYPRIDVFTVNNLGQVEVIKGVPAAEPQKPSIDPSTHLELTFVLIPANATEPPTITDEIIWDENVEWTGTVNGVTAYFDSTVNPYNAATCINVGNIGNGDTITFTDSAPNNFSDFEILSLWMRLKARPIKGHKLYAAFLLSGNLVSNEIEIAFNSTNTATWQNIALALSAFTFTGETFNAVRFRWIKTGANVDCLADCNC